MGRRVSEVSPGGEIASLFENPIFIIFLIHVLFLGTQHASQMSKCFCEQSPSELSSAWPPGSYSS